MAKIVPDWGLPWLFGKDPHQEEKEQQKPDEVQQDLQVVQQQLQKEAVPFNPRRIKTAEEAKARRGPASAASFAAAPPPLTASPPLGRGCPRPPTPTAERRRRELRGS